jgi:hypothetical protein
VLHLLTLDEKKEEDSSSNRDRSDHENMSSSTHIYDHFSAYGLAQRGTVAKRLAQFAPDELAQFLAIYKRQAELRWLATRALVGDTDIYPDSWDTAMDLDVIKQLAIYANRVYLHDRLLELACGWPGREYELSSLLQFSSSQERERHALLEVAEAIEEMLTLRPLVEAEIVYFTPTYLIQDHRDPRDVYLDNFYGDEGSAEALFGQEKPFELPPAFRAYMREHFHVVPASRENGRHMLSTSRVLAPRRMIALYFDGDPSPHIELLGHVSASDQEEGVIHMHYPLDGQTPPDEALFWNWVEGTKRKVITERVKRLQLDCALASAAGAKLLTSLSASRDLVTLNTGEQTGKSTDPLVALLRMELPYFDRASFDSIARARQNEVAFEDFRSAFNQAMREINQLSSPQEVQARIDELSRDLLRIPLARIDQCMKQLRPTLFPGAAILAGTLLSTLLLQGSPLLAGGTILGGTIWGGTEVLKARVAREAQLARAKELPSFFYWELTHPTNPRGRKRLTPAFGRGGT